MLSLLSLSVKMTVSPWANIPPCQVRKVQGLLAGARGAGRTLSLKMSAAIAAVEQVPAGTGSQF